MDNLAQIIAQLLGTVHSSKSGAKARHQAMDKADDTPPMGHVVPPSRRHASHQTQPLCFVDLYTQHIAYGVLHTPFLLGIR